MSPGVKTLRSCSEEQIADYGSLYKTTLGFLLRAIFPNYLNSDNLMSLGEGLRAFCRQDVEIGPLRFDESPNKLSLALPPASGIPFATSRRDSPPDSVRQATHSLRYGDELNAAVR